MPSIAGGIDRPVTFRAERRPETGDFRMGVLSPGLYADDFAMDLKPALAALARLPLPGDELVGLLAASHSGIADNPADEEHSTFWLVAADRFGKLGVNAPRARAMALAIIDEGRDLASLKARGMSPRDLAKRAAMLTRLRSEIAAFSPSARPRKTLAAPEPYLMELGDCLVFPVSRGQALNPYLGDRTRNTDWHQDGYGAGILCARGRAFGYLAWYRFCVLDQSFPVEPGLAEIRAGRFGLGLRPGTLSARHMKRLELRRIGRFDIDADAVSRMVRDKVREVAPEIYTINEVSLCNNLTAERQTWFNGPPVASVIRGGS
jgi:hypothetical protein